MAEQGPPRWRENGAAAKAIFTPVAHRSTSDHHVMKMRCYQGYFHASAQKKSSRNFGQLEAPRLPLARERGIDHVIDKVIVEPFGLPPNALSPKTQPLGYGATLLVLGCARDAYPVKVELPKGVIDQRPACGGHESFALVLLS